MIKLIKLLIAIGILLLIASIIPKLTNYLNAQSFDCRGKSVVETHYYNRLADQYNDCSDNYNECMSRLESTQKFLIETDKELSNIKEEYDKEQDKKNWKSFWSGFGSGSALILLFILIL